MMDERRIYHVAVFANGPQLSAELRAALQQHDGPPRFVVASSPCPQALDPCACELLIIDLDGQASQRLELLTQCRGLYPHLPAIVLVGRDDTSTAVAAMKAGAKDCLEKPWQESRLLSAVTAALGGQQSSWQQVCRGLTRTETKVLRLVLAGMTSLQIAEQFHRSRRTIEVHRRNIMRKLGVSHVSELVKQAFR
jgi:DNA-binding NarL/FixJ family response regulator